MEKRRFYMMFINQYCFLHNYTKQKEQKSENPWKDFQFNKNNNNE